MNVADDLNLHGARPPGSGMQSLGGFDIRAYVVGHLDEAIENGWIVVHYQPVLNSACGGGSPVAQYGWRLRLFCVLEGMCIQYNVSSQIVPIHHPQAEIFMS